MNTTHSQSNVRRPRGAARFILCACAVASLTGSAIAQSTIRASVTYTGGQSNGASLQAHVSANGQYVVFRSFATNLLGFGTSSAQIFKRDIASGTTTLVSGFDIASQANAECFNPRVSSDGRYVVFSSDATNLVLDDFNGVRDVFVRDMVANTITRVSVGDDESEATDVSDSGWMSAMSGSNQRVLFRSVSTNLVPGGTTGSQLFVRDMVAGTTVLVSRENGAFGLQANDYCGVQPSMTPDGRYVGFSSRASNLVAGDTNGVYDVYVRDTLNHTNRRISIALNGNQGWQDSFNSSMSDDGRSVAFVSNQGFVNGDTNGLHDVFVRFTPSSGPETMARASVDTQEKQATGGPSGGTGNWAGWGTKISPDGTKVVFQSSATNLIKGDSNGVEDVFIRNLTAGSTAMVSLNTSGKPANGISVSPTLSGNGYVSFASDATNLVPGDTNASTDIFRRGAY